MALALLGLGALSACGSNEAISLARSVPPVDTFAEPTEATPAPTDAVRGTQPVLEYRVRGVGYTSTQLSVRARRVLRVRFAPGRQDAYVAGSGFSPQYSGLGVFIRAGASAERATPLLSNGLRGAAQQSEIMDFSAQLQGCNFSTDVNCRSQIQITIAKPQYDYWCFTHRMYCAGMGGVGSNPFPGYTVVEPNHPWNGTLFVETDDTVPLN